MFGWIKQGWAEARGDVASKEVADILTRYRAPPTRDYQWLVFAAFDSTLDSVKGEADDLSGLNDDAKRDLAKQLMTAARQAAGLRGDSIHAATSRIGANGVALLSLFVEAQTLPGDKAASIVRDVSAWHVQEHERFHRNDAV